MARATTFYGEIFEDGTARVHGLLTDGDLDNTPLLTTDFGSMDYWVIDLATDTTVVTETSITVANVLSNTLNSHGNNFDFTIPSTSFAAGTRKFELHIRFTLGSGDIGQALIILDATKITAA